MSTIEELAQAALNRCKERLKSHHKTLTEDDLDLENGEFAKRLKKNRGL